MHARGEPSPIRLASRYGVLLILTLGSVHMMSQVLRNSIGVIAPDLATELALTPGQLGLLASSFFAVFALAQIPLGLALDRFGARTCLLACSAIGVLGCALFALAVTPAALIAARCLMGLGCSCFLMAPLAFYARRFPADRFAVLASFQLGLGAIGTLIATAPLAWGAAYAGWRTAFAVFAAVLALTGILAVALVVPRKGPRPDSKPGQSLREDWAGFMEALRTRYVPHIFFMNLLTISTFALIVGLWGGPYLSHIYGYDLPARGTLLLLAAIGQIIGMLLNGPLERLVGGPKPVVIAGASLNTALLVLLIAFGTLPELALGVWLFVFGLTSAYSPALIGHGKSLFPTALLGRGLSVLNVGVMLGVFWSQSLSGALIGMFPLTSSGASPLSAYRVAFAVQAVLAVAAITAYVFVRPPKKSN